MTCRTHSGRARVALASVLLGVLVGAVPCFAAPAARAKKPHEPRLLLTWNAPYGRPGATTTLDATGGDTTRVDTLYLCFDPGHDSAGFLGVSATLYFRAADGDTLGDYWQIKNNRLEGAPIRVVFDHDPDHGFDTPWAGGPGAGGPFYDFVAGSGRLRLLYAVPKFSAIPIKGGNVYGFARVLFRRPAATAGGYGAPICVEWQSSWLSYGGDDNLNVNRGARWVSINSPDGTSCDPFRDALAPKVWSPDRPKRP